MYKYQYHFISIFGTVRMWAGHSSSTKHPKLNIQGREADYWHWYLDRFILRERLRALGLEAYGLA